jgi:hypothetical protein
MRSPSIVPGFNADVYVVLDDFGTLGRTYREVDEAEADKATLIRDLIAGQFNNPVRVVAFNTAEGWSRDVSEEIAREIRAEAERTGAEMSPGLREWIEWQIDLVRRAGRVRVQP